MIAFEDINTEAIKIAEEDYQLCSNAMGCYLEPQKLKEKLVVQIQR